MNLPGYDAWKLDTPPSYEMTPEEENAQEREDAQRQQDFREAIARTFSDHRRDIYLATIREIVIEELNKLRPGPGEPPWQTKTPVPVPERG